MRDSEEKKSKKQELINKFDFSESSLKQAEDFFQTKNIPFVAKENTTFTFIDLFAGIGGFRLAMQANGGECVFSSEWDTQAQKTYFANYGEVPFGDITLRSTKDYIPDNFDVLCAGFPCQPFSISGKEKGSKSGTSRDKNSSSANSSLYPRLYAISARKGSISHSSANLPAISLLIWAISHFLNPIFTL